MGTEGGTHRRSRSRGASLQLSQRYQAFEGTLRVRARSRPLQGRIEGATLRTPDGRAGALVLQWEEEMLKVVQAAGPLGLAQGGYFSRAKDSHCG